MTTPILEVPLRWTEGVRGPPWSTIAVVIVAMALFGTLNLVLTRHVASRWPGPVFVGLLVVANMALLAVTLPVLVRIHARARESTRVILRVGSEFIDVESPEARAVRVPRAALRVRRLRVLYTPPTSDSISESPIELIALELSGPGLDPLVIARTRLTPRAAWTRPDATLERLPEFQLDETDWTKLREALGVPL